MSSLSFTKMQGLGNDFIIVDKLTTPLNQKQIKFMCDRKFGIGADQLLVLEAAHSKDFDYYYTIFNPDGSEAEQCGNGARCVIKYLKHLHPAKTTIKLKTANRIIHGNISEQNTSDMLISVNMASPKFNSTTVDLIENYPGLQKNSSNMYTFKQNEHTINFGIVSMGNPHAVIQISDEEKLTDLATLKAQALALQNCGAFTKGVNVNFFCRLNQHQVKLRTYERGAGFTLACGSGASATISHAILNQLIRHHADVLMDGGQLKIQWAGGNNDLWMTGAAQIVFTGQIKLCN